MDTARTQCAVAENPTPALACSNNHFGWVICLVAPSGGHQASVGASLFPLHGCQNDFWVGVKIQLLNRRPEWQLSTVIVKAKAHVLALCYDLPNGMETWEIQN